MFDFSMLEEKYRDVDETILVKKARNGNSSAQEYLIRKYMGIVKSKARNYFIIGGSKEDIIQEGMIGIFKAIRYYDETKNDSFSPFVDLCVRRQIITAIKRASRKKHKPLNSYISLNKPMYDKNFSRTLIDTVKEKTVFNPENLIISNENIGMIEEKIDNVLSKFELKVLSMYLDGYSYKSISKALNKKEKSVDNALQRVKKKLDKHLNI